MPSLTNINNMWHTECEAAERLPEVSKLRNHERVTAPYALVAVFLRPDIVPVGYGACPRRKPKDRSSLFTCDFGLSNRWHVLASSLNRNGEIAMTTLTIKDLNNEVNGEPRLLDIKLGKFLGFKRPRDIRKLVERNREYLERFGSLCAVCRKTGGRPATEYYLNKKQCTYLCAKSDTEIAAEKTVEIVEVYDAAANGTLKPHSGAISKDNIDLAVLLATRIIAEINPHNHKPLHQHINSFAERITELLGKPMKYIPAHVAPVTSSAKEMVGYGVAKREVMAA